MKKYGNNKEPLKQQRTPTQGSIAERIQEARDRRTAAAKIGLKQRG